METDNRVVLPLVAAERTLMHWYILRVLNYCENRNYYNFLENCTVKKVPLYFISMILRDGAESLVISENVQHQESLRQRLRVALDEQKLKTAIAQMKLDRYSWSLVYSVYVKLVNVLNFVFSLTPPTSRLNMRKKYDSANSANERRWDDEYILAEPYAHRALTFLRLVLKTPFRLLPDGEDVDASWLVETMDRLTLMRPDACTDRLMTAELQSMDVMYSYVTEIADVPPLFFMFESWDRAEREMNPVFDCNNELFNAALVASDEPERSKFSMRSVLKDGMPVLTHLMKNFRAERAKYSQKILEGLRLEDASTSWKNMNGAFAWEYLGLLFFGNDNPMRKRWSLRQMLKMIRRVSLSFDARSCSCSTHTSQVADFLELHLDNDKLDGPAGGAESAVVLFAMHEMSRFNRSPSAFRNAVFGCRSADLPFKNGNVACAFRDYTFDRVRMYLYNENWKPHISTLNHLLYVYPVENNGDSRALSKEFQQEARCLWLQVFRGDTTSACGSVFNRTTPQYKYSYMKESTAQPIKIIPIVGLEFTVIFLLCLRDVVFGDMQIVPHIVDLLMKPTINFESSPITTVTLYTFVDSILHPKTKSGAAADASAPDHQRNREKLFYIFNVLNVWAFELTNARYTLLDLIMLPLSSTATKA